MFSNLTPKVQTRIGYVIALGTMGPLIVWALFTTHQVEGVKSSLINLTLPPGSTGTADNDGSGEIWRPHPGVPLRHTPTRDPGLDSDVGDRPPAVDALAQAAPPGWRQRRIGVRHPVLPPHCRP